MEPGDGCFILYYIVLDILKGYTNFDYLDGAKSNNKKTWLY